MNYETMESEDHEYVSELAEMDDEQLDDLSSGFWKRLGYAKQLDQELEADGVDVGVTPAIEDHEEYDISFAMGAEDTGDQLDVLDHPDVPVPSAYEWDEAPAVLNLIAGVGGEVVSVDAWSHSKKDSATLGIGARFPQLES